MSENISQEQPIKKLSREARRRRNKKLKWKYEHECKQIETSHKLKEDIQPITNLPVEISMTSSKHVLENVFERQLVKKLSWEAQKRRNRRLKWEREHRCEQIETVDLNIVFDPTKVYLFFIFGGCDIPTKQNFSGLFLY